ncbi:histidine kinase [Nonomuraea sp. NPDC050404]|uniref:sensor histidine kinase n=1 Tax=Nonomuraea sp. NPDC050404 TaxID=3155783 RepID=UPI0033D51092
MRRNLPRRWACLVLGGALLMPYMMVGVLISGLLRGESANLLLPVQVGVFGAVLPVVAVTGLFLPVRGLSVNAAQGLLGARVETPPRQAGRSWQERRRTAAWFTLHLGVGGVVSGCTLAIVPFTVFMLVLPFTGRGTDVLGFLVTPGWNAAAWAVGGLVLLAALVATAAGTGELLARLAPVLLGPTPAERLAAAEEHARTLAERNRLARELHDSVGHALSVVTLQAAAAGRVLDRDPATARTALTAIENSARTALADLDHVLGVLRDGEPRPDPSSAGIRPDDPDSEAHRDTHREAHRDTHREAHRGPQATLDDLGELVAASGAQVRQEVGDLSGVPAVVSREAYRILQEALTNAIKHGHGPITLTAAIQDDALRLEVTNRLGATPDGAGDDDAGGGGAGSGGAGSGGAGSGGAGVGGAAAGGAVGDGAGARAGEPGVGNARVDLSARDGGAPAGSGPRNGSARAGGRGIAGMRERVGLLRGDLEAGPAEIAPANAGPAGTGGAEGGWRVRVRLPLRSRP